MPKLTIDGIEIEVEKGTSVLQACEQLGIEVPRFCYHDRLSVPANCRMCLVEMKNAPKPIASCAMQANDGMEIFTDSEKTKKARKGVMEFLLINHPLDCPICDQGGECDLQDQAMAYGFDRSRFDEMKRAVADKYMGPLIKTIMTRCIHCTRCVRFADEIAGVPELGQLGRGEDSEIGTYVEEAVKSELSGNMIDICPVGALTSKPYAFNARPWELKKTETIDALDAVGASIRVDVRGPDVLRVLPRLHEDVNEEWLGDKSRFAYDGLRRQRLDRPFMRVDGKRRAVAWEQALMATSDRLTKTAPGRVAAIVGDMADAESIFALKSILDGLGVTSLECRQDGARFPLANRGDYLFNTTIAGAETADAVLLVGSNPRWEAPLINARIRKAWVNDRIKVAGIGRPHDQTYPVEWLGAGPDTLTELAEGRLDFAKVLEAAERPMLVLGMGALRRADGEAVHAAAVRATERFGLIKDDWCGFNLLHTAAARVGALDLGFVPGQGGRDLAGIYEACAAGEIDTVFLLGADEVDTTRLGHATVIYLGHHGDRGASRADILLPGAAYTEKSATFVNTEGRVQVGRQALFPPGEAREDWRVLRALSEMTGTRLPFDSLLALRDAMASAHPLFAAIDQVTPARPGPAGRGSPSSLPFVPAIDNYYMTDPISRASETMAACTAEFLGTQEGTGTDG